MNIALTRVSSKGQVVIPVEMREKFEEGKQIIVMKNDNQLIMKPVSSLDKQLREDITFAKRTEAALKRYERGEFKKMSFDEFLKQAKKW